jgi:hypothetical protein
MCPGTIYPKKATSSSESVESEIAGVLVSSNSTHCSTEGCRMDSSFDVNFNMFVRMCSPCQVKFNAEMQMSGEDEVVEKDVENEVADREVENQAVEWEVENQVIDRKVNDDEVVEREGEYDVVETAEVEVKKTPKGKQCKLRNPELNS